jgi:hypothetical protein
MLFDSRILKIPKKRYINCPPNTVTLRICLNLANVSEQNPTNMFQLHMSVKISGASLFL